MIAKEWPRDPLAFDRSVPEPEEGHAWIQWKGTNVCMDVQCKCGESGHVDAEFAYFYSCPGCGRLFAVGQTVRLYELALELEQKTRETSSCIVTGES